MLAFNREGEVQTAELCQLTTPLQSFSTAAQRGGKVQGLNDFWIFQVRWNQVFKMTLRRELCSYENLLLLVLFQCWWHSAFLLWISLTGTKLCSLKMAETKFSLICHWLSWRKGLDVSKLKRMSTSPKIKCLNNSNKSNWTRSPCP